MNWMVLPLGVLVVLLATVATAQPNRPRLPEVVAQRNFWDKVKIRVTRNAEEPSVGIFFEDSPESLARDIAEMESSGTLAPVDRSKRGGLLIIMIIKAILAILLADELF